MEQISLIIVFWTLIGMFLVIFAMIYDDKYLDKLNNLGIIAVVIIGLPFWIGSYILMILTEGTLKTFKRIFFKEEYRK